MTTVHRQSFRKLEMFFFLLHYKIQLHRIDNQSLNQTNASFHHFQLYEVSSDEKIRGKECLHFKCQATLEFSQKDHIGRFEMGKGDI